MKSHKKVTNSKIFKENKNVNKVIVKFFNILEIENLT